MKASPGVELPDEYYPSRDPRVAARTIVLGEAPGVRGERVRIVESGDPDAFPIVLLHGWGASAYNFRGILGALAESGFRAIAPDLRGHGWSETELSGGAWTRAAMARWVEQVLDALDVRHCLLVGQSIGGAVALDAAAFLPDRVGAVVLLAPIGFTPVRRVLLARALGRMHPSTTPRWVVSFILRRIYGTRGRWNAQDLEEYWAPLRRTEVVRAIMQSAREFDFVPRDPQSLQLGQCRVFIRFGERDRLIPHEAAMRHAERFPGVDVSVLAGVGHVPAEEVPDEVFELICSAWRRLKAEG